MRNKSVQLIIVPRKICKLSLQTQEKCPNSNSAFFCSTAFFFVFLSTLNVKGTVNYANKENVRLKNRYSFVE